MNQQGRTWEITKLIPDRPINIALATLPTCLDAVIKSDGKIGILSKENLEAQTGFGPLIDFADNSSSPLLDCSIILSGREIYNLPIDASYPHNWIKLVGRSDQETEQNADLVLQPDGKTYLVLTKDVAPGEELITILRGPLKSRRARRSNASRDFGNNFCRNGSSKKSLLASSSNVQDDVNMELDADSLDDELMNNHASVIDGEGKINEEWAEKKLRKKRTCLFCPFTGDLASVQDHAGELHREKGYFVCSECSQRFSKYKNLVNHYISHIKGNSRTCRKCGKEFATRDLLDEHRATHKSEEFVCSECNTKFKHAKSLYRHVRHFHTNWTNLDVSDGVPRGAPSRYKSGAFKYACKECKKAYSNHWSYGCHMDTHHPGTSSTNLDQEHVEENKSKVAKRLKRGLAFEFSCPDCVIFFDEKDLLDLHRQEHHPTSPEFVASHLVCPKVGCVYLGNDLYDVLFHLRTHARFFACHVCDMKCITETGLKEHLAEQHDIIPSHAMLIECEICKEKCEASAMNKHLKTHQDHNTSLCVICVTCVEKGKLQQHAEEHRHDDGRFHCRICDNKLSSYDKLRDHHKNTHDPSVNRVCPDCGKHLTSRNGLKLHLLTHVQKAAFKCAKCGASFKAVNWLYKHVRKICFPKSLPPVPL